MVAPTSATAAEPSWLASLQALAHELPGLLSDRVELLSLELHRAGLALAQIVALIVVAAILAATAWLALWGCAVLALMAAGLHGAVALLIVLLLNAAACAVAVARVFSLALLLKLPATRRHLTLRVVPDAPALETPAERMHRVTSSP